MISFFLLYLLVLLFPVHVPHVGAQIGPVPVVGPLVDPRC